MYTDISKYRKFVDDCMTWDNGSQANVPKPNNPLGDVPKDDDEIIIPEENSDDAGTSIVISMCLIMTTMTGLMLV